MNAKAEWLGGVDFAARSRFVRSINVAGAGTVLVQTLINKVVQQINLRELGAGSTLPRKPGSGPGAYINRRAPAGTLAEWVADTGSLTEATGGYTQANFPYQTIAVKGRVTRKMQAIGRSYGDILAQEIVGRAGDLSESLESALFIGDTGSNANQINGLLTLINAVSGQVVSQTSAAAGDVLSLDKLDQAIDVVKGSGNKDNMAIYANFAGRRAINNALQAQQQFMNEVEIAGGFRVKSYDGIPIITTTGLPSNLTWNGTNVTALSGGLTTAIVIVNRDYVWIEDLTPMTVMPLAKVSSQYDEFDIYEDLACVFANTKGASILGGIAP